MMHTCRLVRHAGGKTRRVSDRKQAPASQIARTGTRESQNKAAQAKASVLKMWLKSSHRKGQTTGRGLSGLSPPNPEVGALSGAWKPGSWIWR
jgi:hypothetical protein